jgi:hypothetical protein
MKMPGCLLRVRREPDPSGRRRRLLDLRLRNLLAQLGRELSCMRGCLEPGGVAPASVPAGLISRTW